MASGSAQRRLAILEREIQRRLDNALHVFWGHMRAKVGSEAAYDEMLEWMIAGDERADEFIDSDPLLKSLAEDIGRLEPIEQNRKIYK